MMSHPNEQPTPAAELDTLLVAVVLGDATTEQIDRLNDLLLDDLANRRHAVQFLGDEAALRHQFQMLGRVGDFHTSCRDMASSLSTPELSSKGWRIRSCDVSARRLRFLFASSVSAILLLAVVLVTRYVWMERVPSNQEQHHSIASGSGESDRTNPSRQSTRLPHVTKVSWAGPQFASEFDARPSSFDMRPGVAAFTSVNGSIAEGFMIELPPGGLLDLVVAADADGENALAVIEFESDGRATGRKMSYSNSVAEATTMLGRSENAPPRRRYGPLGTWAERNNGPRSRFYFFTCVHKLVHQSANDQWHISRLSVLLDEADLMHLGWDDGGLFHEKNGEYTPDNDFDDLSATIRVFRAGRAPAEEIRQLRLLPKADVQAANVNEPAAEADAVARQVNLQRLLLRSQSVNIGFPFSVAAGEAVIVKISNRATVPSSLSIVDKDSGHLQWRCEHQRPDFGNTGFCAIKNDTEGPRDFLLIGIRNVGRSHTALDPWRLSDFSVLFDQDAFTTVEFEGGGSSLESDKVKVDMVRMSSLIPQP